MQLMDCVTARVRFVTCMPTHEPIHMHYKQGPKAGVAIDTYDDHRMAMAFALTACAGVPVVINDPKCTRKTFPTYFNVFESVVKH